MPLMHELSWATGFLEGEGHFWKLKHGSTLYVDAVQVQKWPLERLQRLFGGKIHLNNQSNPNWSPIWKWRVCGRRAAGAMFTLYTLLSPARRRQIDEKIAAWKKHATCRQKSW